MKTILSEITLEEFRLCCLPYEILLGQKLMFSLQKQSTFEKKENDNVDTQHENENEAMETDEILLVTANDIVNQSVEMLDCSS